MPGPIPNRDSDLSRPRSRRGAAGGNAAIEATKGTMRPVTIPEPDPDWHPIARMMWDSLASSGMADFYQNSDWAFAYHLCEEISLYKKPVTTYTDKDTGEERQVHKRNGQILTAINSGFERLGVAEGDRRRMRIELEKPAGDEKPAAVLQLAKYKQALKDASGPSDEGPTT